MQDAGAVFRLIDPPPRVQRILELSGMDRKLSIEKIYHAAEKPAKEEASCQK